MVTLLLCLAELAVATVALLQIALMCIMKKVFIETMKHKGVWQGEHDTFNIADELYWVVVNVATAVGTLWMHLIPVVGTVFYCAINGAVSAPIPAFTSLPAAYSATEAPRQRACDARE